LLVAEPVAQRVLPCSVVNGDRQNGVRLGAADEVADSGDPRNGHNGDHLGIVLLRDRGLGSNTCIPAMMSRLFSPVVRRWSAAWSLRRGGRGTWPSPRTGGVGDQLTGFQRTRASPAPEHDGMATAPIGDMRSRNSVAKDENVTGCPMATAPPWGDACVRDSESGHRLQSRIAIPTQLPARIAWVT